MNDQEVLNIPSTDSGVFADCESFLTDLSTNKESMIAGGHYYKRRKRKKPPKHHRDKHCHIDKYGRHRKHDHYGKERRREYH